MCKIEKSLYEIRKSLRVDNEKSLCEKKKSPLEIVDCFFFWAGETLVSFAAVIRVVTTLITAAKETSDT